MLTFNNDFKLLNLCLKKDTDVAHYNFNAHQPILVIFGRNVAEKVCHRVVICYPTSSNLCLCTTWGNVNSGNCLFSHPVYRVSKTTLLWLAMSSTIINQF